MKHDRLLPLLALLGFVSVLLVATHWPGKAETPSGGNGVYEAYHLDKSIHCTAYAVMAALTARHLYAWRLWSRWSALAAAVCLLCLAALDEWTQQFVQRTPDLLDWLADYLGIVIGLTLFHQCWQPRLNAKAEGEFS